ncbi:MAG TPA: NADH-quinone oxidoreductase subunit C [Candidatus Tripitaka sp. YC43]
MEESLTLKKLRERFPASIIDTHSFRGDDTAVVKRVDVVDICRFLKESPDLSYNFLMDLTAVDYLQMGNSPLRSAQELALSETKGQAKEGRFEVVYHLYSLRYNHRVRIKAPLTEADPTIDSLTPLWAVANWLERECWDMFGIRFDGHPDLKRILLYEQFEGHPLRKDYPLTGRQPLIGPKN